MLEFPPPAHAAVPALAVVPVFTGFARAVVEGLVPGRIFAVDGVGHALHGYGMSLVWGEGLGVAFPEIVEHLKAGLYRDKDEWLQIDPRWQHLDWDHAFDAVGGKIGGPKVQRFTRLNFRFDAEAFRSRHAGPVLPAGWQLLPLGEGGYALGDIGVSPHFFWKTFADFRDHGGGVAAVNGYGEIGAMAFSATRFDDWLEIGIETREAYRGMGLARAVAVAMIGKCLGEGLTPVWACRKENAGSLHLAQSLGFVIEKELPFYRLPAKAG